MTQTNTARSFASWDNQLTGRCQNQRKVGNNTYLVRQDDGSIGMKLHDTVIVAIRKDGRATLNSGGWRTPTTKGRINDALRELGFEVDVVQRSGVWLIYNRHDTGKLLTFADGMQVQEDGTLAGSGPNVARLNKSVKLIREYMNPVAGMLMEGKFPAPNGGDPWNFYMASTDGELMLGGNDDSQREHLTEYMKQKYYFGSLLVRAMEHKLGVKHGDQDTLRGIVSTGDAPPGWRGVISISKVCCWAFCDFMNSKPVKMDIAAKQLSDVLRDYLKHWFNLGK